MNAIYRDAMKRVFPTITLEVGLLGFLLVILLFPGLPWWAKLLLGLAVLVLMLRVIAAVHGAAQDVIAEQDSTFVPLEPLDGVGDGVDLGGRP
ncbi:hypothetical protein IHN32_01885 [Deinococcus sp. 14RED07]|uniref:hypothetical protein n=1 Tax=Deinococcus sp. 14RED07 TaxID=2745874 RepID=UPI001E391764|nr:hypothetical protein [Deinococcus sp. 14RED07]MCD0174704.1 hypothetical protein [Deinococcus sp. 14RED07]